MWRNLSRLKKACIFLRICKTLIRTAKRLHFLFLAGRGRPDSGERCSALRSGSSALFPPLRPPPRKCSPGRGRRRDFERSGCGAGCGADPEPRDLRSVFAMRLLGAAFASAVGRGPLPRVPAALGWRGKQVSVPARRDRTGGTSLGPCGPRGAGSVPHPFPPWRPLSGCADEPLVSSRLLVPGRLAAPAV